MKQNFKWTDEEKEGYWQQAAEMLEKVDKDIGIDKTSFGICPQGAIVYLHPLKRNKKNKERWKNIKEIPGLEEKITPMHLVKPEFWYGRITLPWMEE